MICSDGCLWYEENYVETTAANTEHQNIHTECRPTYTNETSKETCTRIQSPPDAYGTEYTINVCSDGEYNIAMSNGTYVSGSTKEQPTEDKPYGVMQSICANFPFTDGEEYKTTIVELCSTGIATMEKEGEKTAVYVEAYTDDSTGARCTVQTSPVPDY